MKCYISTARGKRLTISSGEGCFWEVMKVKGSTRRLSYRSLLPTVLILGVILPFLFIRTAFLAIEASSICSSIDCMRWRLGPRFFGGSDVSLKLTSELTRALVEAKEENVDERGIDGSPSTFNDLVVDITSNKQDIKAFAFKTKAMILKMENKVRAARQQELIYRHLASYGIPKSMHCLSLKLAEEYSINALARSPLPLPEFVYRLANPSYHHIALLTDNVLASSVVISSAVKNTAHPEKLVFHIVTDKKTYASMHAWFALNPVTPSVVEVKGLHQFDWPLHVNVRIKEMLEIHRSIRNHYVYFNNGGQGEDFAEGDYGRKLKAPSPSCLSLMNHLRIYLPELFPKLNKIIFLDDDVVVQNDLSALWALDLNGKVNGAVVSSRGGGEDDKHYHCPGNKYGDFLNFSNPRVSSEFRFDSCAWLYGMNIFDLQAWRKSNITKTYRRWLKLNLNSGFVLWHPGALPPALIAFEGHVHPIDPSWHVAGLGDNASKVSRITLDAAAVIHFSGPAKPWLEISFPELRSLWNRHINESNEFIMNCKIME